MKDVQAVAKYLQAQDRDSTCVLATLVSVEGSSYRRAGARMLLLADGRRIGSISGGCLEEDVLIHAREVAADGRPKLLAYDTGSENELVWGPGSGCGGTVRVLWNAFRERRPGRSRSKEISVRGGRPGSKRFGLRRIPHFLEQGSLMRMQLKILHHRQAQGLHGQTSPFSAWSSSLHPISSSMALETTPGRSRGLRMSSAGG
jgi:xanthine/CO dehydrogenase XdhC/CoxF family maturation factor